MIIGEHIRIQGTIESLGEGSEDVVVRGRIEGTVRVEGALVIDAGAWVLAEVHARRVTILGTVRGNVTARESIELARTGRMVGDARAPQVTVAAGASFRGRMGMGELPEGDVEPPPFAARAALTATVAAPAPGLTPTAASVAPAAPAVRTIPPLARPSGALRRRADSPPRPAPTDPAEHR